MSSGFNENEEPRISMIEKLSIYDSILRTAYDYCNEKRISLLEYHNILYLRINPNADLFPYKNGDIINFKVIDAVETLCKMKNIPLQEYQRVLKFT